ncbi:hypothetical protein [Maridesulfovibrio sp.]|uniref:hypothetical protein n=1 Tax=Maridesulfovibrio sp. TaxID=2795000 RepID=UPI0029CA7CCA|nr:hypothetical protein [Maridesulfovibrio sp.]
MNTEMVDPRDLINITAYEAFRLALKVSGKTEAEVREEMGYSESHCHRVFSVEEYYTSYEKIPKLCKFLDNNIIILWLIVQADKDMHQPIYHEMDCPELLKEAAELLKETSDVGKEVGATIEDNEIKLTEIRRVIREVCEVVAKGICMLGKLRMHERFLSLKVKKSKA